MVNLIILLTNLFRIYLIYRYIKVFEEKSMDQEEKRVARCFAFATFFLVNTGSYLMFHSAWVNLIVNLFGIILLTCMYLKSLKTSFFIGCSIYLINMICDTAATLPFIEYKYGQETNNFSSVIMVFLFFICELLAEKIVVYKKDKDMVQNLPLAMMLVPISSIVTFSLLMYVESSSQTVLLIVTIGFLFINFLLLYLYNMLLRLFTQHYENETLKQKVKIYANQIKIILESEEKLKLLKHDMKHHLNELKLLAMKGNTSSMLEYIEDMEIFMKNPNELISSGNIEIDSVINYMVQRAKTSLLNVNVKIQIPEEISHSFDINIVLGNLLENAIEAAVKTEEKTLNAIIRLSQGILRIEIENSYSEAGVPQEFFKNGQVYTTKKAQENHGYGLKSVRKVVEKYHGILEIYPKEGRFCVKVILYLVQADKV